MMKCVSAFAVVLALAGSASAFESSIPPHKRESIRTLLVLTGMEGLVDQMIGQMFESFAKNIPSVPPEVWDRLKKKMKADELIELMVPVYDKYYTQDDLDGMIAFYRTPLGQKVIHTLPDVSRESFAIGEQWGRQKGQEVMQEIRAEGLVKD